MAKKIKIEWWHVLIVVFIIGVLFQNSFGRTFSPENNQNFKWKNINMTYTEAYYAGDGWVSGRSKSITDDQLFLNAGEACGDSFTYSRMRITTDFDLCSVGKTKIDGQMYLWVHSDYSYCAGYEGSFGFLGFYQGCGVNTEYSTNPVFTTVNLNGTNYSVVVDDEGHNVTHSCPYNLTMYVRANGGKYDGKSKVSIIIDDILFDSDGDGIWDVDDECPLAPGVLMYAGCNVPDGILCWDGNYYSSESDCPERNASKYTCWDYTVVTNPESCPAPPIGTNKVIEYTCWDDTLVSDPDECPIQETEVETSINETTSVNETTTTGSTKTSNETILLTILIITTIIAGYIYFSKPQKRKRK